MSYVKVNIPKNGDGAGCPVSNSSDIYVIDIEDVLSEPTREVGNTAMVGDITLKTGAVAQVIYGTPSTISDTEEYSGDPDAHGVIQGIAFDHPGNSTQIKNFIEYAMNRSFIVLVKECDGSEAGRVQYFGNKCNPLVLTPERTSDTSANKRRMAFAQAMVGKFLPGDYSGELPATASEATGASETA